MKFRIAGIFLVIITIIFAAGCVASSPAAESGNQDAAASMTVPLSQADEATSKNLDEYMTALDDAGQFSGTVLVARGDTILLSKGYGMANNEFSVPNTPQTVFPIASNTKQFTAAAIMKLQEQGRLNITDPVTDYIPDAPRWKDIRIYNLMNHTSGIPSLGGYCITDSADIALPELVKRFADLPLTFEPGEGYAYSNNGYTTLSYIIEQASGLSYDDYLMENFFLPLEMTSTGPDNARDVFPNRASGYNTMDGKQIHYDLLNIHNLYGAGSLHSTTEDLFLWERAFHTPGVILTSPSLDAMTEYDYGIASGVMNNRTSIGFSGHVLGFNSGTSYLPDGDVSVMFLLNHDRTPMANLYEDLPAIVFNESYSLPQKIDQKVVSLTAEELGEYVGIYPSDLDETWMYTVFTEGNRLFYTSDVPYETVELFFEGNDTFFMTPESADSVIFTRDTNGTVNDMNME